MGTGAESGGDAQELARRHEAVQYYMAVAEAYDKAGSQEEAQDVLTQADLPDLAALHQAMAHSEAAVANFGRSKRKYGLIFFWLAFW